MTPYGRDDAPKPFTPGELDGVADVAPDELLALGSVARELQAVADRGGVRHSPDFADRVMRAIAAEPSPAPVWAVGVAVRRHSVGAMVASFRDAVRVSFGVGFPIAVRAQALALVLVLTAVVATGSGVATVGAVHLLNGSPQSGVPDATPVPVATNPAETPSGSLDPSAISASPDASEPGEPSVSGHPDASSSEPPSESPEPTNTGSGNGGGTTGTSGTSGGASHVGSPTPAPTDTPRPTEGDHEHGSPAPGGSSAPPDAAHPMPTPSSSPADLPIGYPLPEPKS